ncbi:MFS transporter [Chitinasiproducens palmae]|uniref:Cyanate permease n=1 Tax=Chitinasiproducens palmae TaxID=1770053 RepID=A0A1H2PMS8_9BURK|nr:MFS transporter [Chitinasiproducens palmae]SDV47794.1 Cyanate permease [Chitinasiproducens palmae]
MIESPGGAGPAALRRATRAIVWRYVAVALFFDSLPTLTPQLALAFGLSSNAFQTVLGSAFVAFALAQLASAPVIARVGTRTAIVCATLYLGVGATLVCLVTAPFAFVLIFLSMFAVNSIGSNATRLLTARLEQGGGRGVLFARAYGWAQAKNVVAPLLVGAIAATFGWRMALLMAIAPVIAVGIWVGSAMQRIDGISPDCSPRTRCWLAVLRSRSFIVPTLIAAAFQPAFGCAAARLPFHLADRVGADAFAIGLTVALASAAIATGVVVGSRLARRWSSRRSIAVGSLMMGAGLICLLLAQTDAPPIIATTGLIAIQSAYGFIVVPCLGEALDTTDERRLPASSLFGFVQPAIGGLSVALSGTSPLSDVATVTVLGTLSLTAIVALLFAARPRTMAL